METSKILRVCGSVVKTETINKLEEHVLKNTVVVEADHPYSKYYGAVPEKPFPNSLFVLTPNYYTLEEVLRITQQIDSCYKNKVNVASSILDFGPKYYPAIRLKNFPGYHHLPELQSCLAKKGIQLCKKADISKYAKVKTNKCFVLEEIEKGILLDLEEKNKGYIVINRWLNDQQFEELVNLIRNNSSWLLFDAEKCGIIIDARVTELIRIFSEKLDLTMLQSIRHEINKLTPELASV